MSGFRPLTTSELQALRPVDLLAHHHEARRLGRHDEARAALGILVWGFHDRVRFWVGRNVPKEHVEDVCGDVFVSAVRSSFEGTEVAQLGAWLRRIAQRRAADLHAARERRVKEEALPEEHEGDEAILASRAWSAGRGKASDQSRLRRQPLSKRQRRRTRRSGRRLMGERAKAG
jgi:DNA-directed RNA polymerase specialized sigma24 family protein